MSYNYYMNIHGNYSIEVCENIIKSKLSGSFNLEGAVEFYNDLIDKIKMFENESYFIYINALDFTGATSEAYIEANFKNQWINETHPPIARVYILSADTKLHIALKEEKELSKQNIQIFRNEENALEWIKINKT